ncbi:MAG: DUF86 domain-containing protein [Flavobacteriales bacterium]|nr:DUF86 domain-containing protein [Flavobacteriales bacterium]
MSNRDAQLLLEDILESAQKILSYCENISFEDFLKDSKTIDAVIRNFEIIGEAANRLSPQFRNANSHIEWTRIRGFRNRIVHDYFGIDYEIVWTIVQDNITYQGY